MKKLFLFTLFLCFSFSAQAQFPDQRNYIGSSGGTANAQTLAVPNYQLNIGVVIRGLMSHTNTGAMTLNVNSTSAIAVEKQTSAGLIPLVGGEVVTGQVSEFIYDGTQFELLFSSSGGNNVTQGTVPWTTALLPSNSSAIGITPVACGSVASGCVLKSSPGNLYSVYVNSNASVYLMIFNSISIPSNGSTTSGTASGNMVECIGPSTSLSISYTGLPPEIFSTGISAAVSTTGCGTLTLSASANFHGYIQ